MTHNTDLDRGRQLTPTRRAMAVAGAATLGFSLVLSIGPVLAAAGTVKIHDALTDEDLGNDPHVCAFYAAFYASDAESGSWELILWDGDRPVVEDGTYDTGGDGADVTPDLAPEPGQYRFEWLPAGDRATKNKMLWVDEDCYAEQESDPTPSSDPSGSGDPSASGDPSGEADPSGDPSASGDPSGEADPSGDPSASGDPSGEPDPSGDVSPSTEGNPSTDPDPSSSPDASNQPAPSDDEQMPSNQPAPSDDEQAPSNQPVPSDNVAQPGQAVDAGNPSGGSGPMLPDTALPVNESGVLAAIGLLLILAAHVGTRRERQLPAA